MTLQPVALPMRSVLVAPTVPASVRLARETAELTYAGWGINPGHPVLGPALLVLSELVTNSVRHAAAASPQLTVTYAASADMLAFAVHDRHPYVLDPLSFPQSRGGLATVAELATEWGGTWTVRPDADGGGKGVWITLPL
ncbi:ATP-binding protein [Streptomyces gilvosporeus]|uniref:ATP-binding protein n=1 Tax=Streptomyces gilvosporeus TaxID=553510 RepID=A0A1V0TYP1_9ACTN|nr:ATP-binding protein [Streptomyces gilvosporeus]ARF58064.1 ATP-binding protein [Streptomyces gilvosporeus]